MKTLKEIIAEQDKRFYGIFRNGLPIDYYAGKITFEGNLKSFFSSVRLELLDWVIDELESNPNPDGSVSPNIQHWIEAKQKQFIEAKEGLVK